MDGETVPVGRPFSNGLDYPRDPRAAPEDSINCMCYMLVLPRKSAAAMGYRVTQ
jgi:hypothetical protein